MLDAHCHLDDPRFDADREHVMDTARRAGVSGFIVAGVSPARWQAQSELARSHPDVYVTYGVHPWEVAQAEPDRVAPMLQELADVLSPSASPGTRALARPVALGETGLDRSRRVPPDSEDRQVSAFRAQLDLARGHDLPVVLHVVHAHGKVLEILKHDGVPGRGGMVHAFSASTEVAAAYMKLGFYLSFGGAVTWERAKLAKAAARATDARLLLCETDAPDLAPADPGAGSPLARNDPANLLKILTALAALRETTVEVLAEATSANARRLFAL